MTMWFMAQLLCPSVMFLTQALCRDLFQVSKDWFVKIWFCPILSSKKITEFPLWKKDIPRITN